MFPYIQLVMRATLPLLSVCLVILMFPGSATSQDEPGQVAPDATADKVVRVVRIESPPVIDGLLDDGVWEGGHYKRCVNVIRRRPSISSRL